MNKKYKTIFLLVAILSLVGCSTNNQEISKLEPSSNDSSAVSNSLDNATSSTGKESQTQSSSDATSKSSSSASSNKSSSNHSSSSQNSGSQPSSSSSFEPVEVYYHVIFQNYDGTILEEQDVLEGSEAIYTGETPTREDDEEYTYEFIGWDKENDLRVVSADITTTAQFEATGIWGPIHWF